ncbi:MAG: 5-formyltetrahydrofolate cyclo-ligase [Roseateles sp.]
MNSTPKPHIDSQPADPDRAALRQRLRELRPQWLGSEDGASAQEALARRLSELLLQLEPEVLGLYWPLEGEFNAGAAFLPGFVPAGVQLALPYAFREGRRMEYRRWDGHADAGVKDECGIPSSDGARVTPDVVLLPCVGFNRAGYRLGYGGGYFDRWLAAHPGVTSVGLAWSCCEAEFAAQAHDLAPTLILTEREVLMV